LQGIRRPDHIFRQIGSPPPSRFRFKFNSFGNLHGRLRQIKRDGALGGACLINAGRGGLQIDGDILAALGEGSLSGATLDVFPTEPLPATSPLWDHPAVTVTPHCAAASDPHALVANILRQIERHEQGLPLEHLVDRDAGY
jgi:glyoxylate/hydroxypyruvate reductase A